MLSPEERAEWKEICQSIAQHLDRIATVLEQTLRPSEPSTPAPCPHPMEARIDFGTTNGQPDFQCRLCGFRSQST